MVLPASNRVSRVRFYSGYRSVFLLVVYGAITLYGHSFQSVLLKIQNPKCGPSTPTGISDWFGLFRFRSPLLTESLLLSFPPGTEMFQFPGFARVSGYQYLFNGSTQLFAVCHALLPFGAKTSPTRSY